jgi:iron complex outermembrane receptor protein
MYQPIRFGAHHGDQASTPSFNFQARAVSAPATPVARQAGGASSFAPDASPSRAIAPAAPTLARPCRFTAMRMSWLGKLRQRRWPVRTGPVAALLLASSTCADLSASLAGEVSAETLRLDDLHITDRVDAPYKNATAISATKTDTALIDLPQSVQVIPLQLIEDLGALEITDLYRNVAGVTQYSYGGVVARGFRQEETRYNGVAGSPYGDFGISRLGNVEQVEVLKGPASVLYGSNQPGGLINIVTRQPRAEPAGKLTARYGSGDSYGLQLDVTGPIDAAHRHLYLFNVATDDQDRFRNNARTESTVYTGGYSWVLSPATRVTVQAERIDQDNSAHRLRGVPFENGRFLTDTTFTTTEPTDFQSLVADVVQARLDHVFTSDLRLNATYRWFDNQGLQQYHEPRGLLADRRTMRREFRDQDRRVEQHSVAVNLLGAFQRGDFAHQVLVGGELYHTNTWFRGLTVPMAQVPTIDIYEPVYGLTSADSYGLGSRPYNTTDADLLRTGVYVQDQFSWRDHWHLLLAARYEYFVDENRLSPQRRSDGAPTTRAGLLRKLGPATSLYYSYAEGFVPQGLANEYRGGPFDPEESTSHEFGFKRDFFDGRAGLTAAIYELTKSNVLQNDPDPAAPADWLTTLGEVRSRGFEIDVTGQLTAAWSLQANYAYNDVVVTRDVVAANIGQGFPNSPRHQAGLWTRCNLPGRLPGFGLGAEYVSTRANSIEVDAFPARGYVVWDAALYWSVGGISLTLRCDNLFDHVYSQSTFGGRNGHFPGEPRNMTLTAAWKF